MTSEVQFVVILLAFALLIVTAVAAWSFYRNTILRMELEVERRVNRKLRNELDKYIRRGVLLAAISSMGMAAADDPDWIGPEQLMNGVAYSLLDARRLPDSTANFTRYLHYRGYHRKSEVARARKVLNAHVNSLSRSGSLAYLRPVSQFVDALYLTDYSGVTNDARVDQSRLNRLASVFGDLAEPRIADDELVTTFSDQYYHVYQIARDGVDPTSDKKHKGKFFIPRGAPWVGPQLIQELQDRCHSRIPIVDARWFVFQTAIQHQRDGHGYYDFLDLGKSVNDFFKLVDIDEKKEEELRMQQAGVLGKSGIAFNNRGIRLGAARGNWHWFTEDYFTSVGRQNVIGNLNGRTIPPHGDANEHYALLPNGLFVMYLNDKNGVRQDFVPQPIALDTEAFNVGSNDRNIHCYMSCVRCHREGLRPIDEYTRNVFRDKLWLGSPDSREFLQLRDLYTRNMEFERRLAVVRYEKSLLDIAEWRPEQFAEGMKWLWYNYERAMSREEVAFELGVTEDQWVKSLEYYHKLPQSALSPLIAGQLANPPVPMRREYFEEYFVIAQSYIMPHGVVWAVPTDKRETIPFDRNVWQPPLRQELPVELKRPPIAPLPGTTVLPVIPGVSP